MSILNLLKECKIVKASTAVSAGTSTITGSTIDCLGFRSALIIACLGDVTATNVPHLQAFQGSDSGGSGAAAASGSSALAAAGASNYDDKMMTLDVKNLAYRYLTPTLVRGTANAVVNFILVILYNGRDCPVTQGSDVISAQFIANPAA